MLSADSSPRATSFSVSLVFGSQELGRRCGQTRQEGAARTSGVSNYRSAVRHLADVVVDILHDHDEVRWKLAHLSDHSALSNLVFLEP